MRGEFSLHYQPEVDVETQRIVGVEALAALELADARRRHARPVHPRRRGDGRDHPARRLRPARGVRTDRTLAPRGSAARRVRHLGEPLGEAARRRRRGDARRAGPEANGLRPDCLGLEVTETAIVVEGPPASVPARSSRSCTTRRPDRDRRLRHRASRRSGTCAASRSTCIKVDRSFVQGVEHDPKDAAITAQPRQPRARTRPLAVAEGIESDGAARVGPRARVRPRAGFLSRKRFPPTSCARCSSQRASADGAKQLAPPA